MSGATMRTAVVRAFGEAPRCEEFAEPVAGEGEALVQVRAAPLKPVDKQLASGGHFAASRELLFVCGTDGVRTLSRWATGIFWRRSRAVARGHFVFRCRTVG